MYNLIDCNVSLWAMMFNVRLPELETHDGEIRTITNVWHAPNVNQNLIYLGSLEGKGFAYSAGGKVPKVSKGAWALLTGLRH